jgi:hypothetical protein
MAMWTDDELRNVGEAEELQLASLRRDGTTREPVTIWVVRCGNDLYVRSVNGRTASWFCGVQDRHDGHICAGGVDKDVSFVETGGDVDDQLDAAYAVKYRHYAKSIIDHITSSGATAATLKLAAH